MIPIKPICITIFLASALSAAGQTVYPLTQRMSNPLFVNLPSPMYEGDGTGPLYTADASAHVWADGRLYLYASHDMEPARGCDRMDRYHVFSTDDMVNWTDHGEILNADDVKRDLGWGSDGFMWAPDCAYNPADSTYYFYFPHPENNENWGTTWRVGVATSKHPAKDFKLVGYVEGVPPLIDPCVYVDDDGQPYIYIGGSAKAFGGRLCKDDWTKLDGPMEPMLGLDDFHEASWIHKYRGKYYLSYSDNHYDRDGNYMRYAVGDSPLGPWTPMGIYMYPTGCETNHGSIVEYKGQWYAFYHAANHSGEGNLRSVCVDPIKINPDGSLEIVRNWGTPYKGKTRVLSEKTLVIPASQFNDGGEHYAYHCHDGRELKRTSVLKLGKHEWARYSVDVPEYSVCDITIEVEGISGKSHLSICGHDISGTLEGKKVYTISGVEIRPGERYLDFRVDDGNVALKKITLKPHGRFNPGNKMYDSYKGLVMAGYQGWFATPRDEMGRGWHHYECYGQFRPGRCTIDLWPDVSDYKLTYATPFVNADGSVARVFSSNDPSTVDTHFRWMKEYGLDGVFMQRFVGEIKGAKGLKHFNNVLNSAMIAANKYDRAICVMYDLSGMSPGDEEILLADIDKIAKRYDLFNHKKNPSYLYHNGRPLVTVWGLGFDDGRRYGLKEGNKIVDGLRSKGYSVMLGVPTRWEQLNGDTERDPGLHELICKCDVVMPWFVGRYNEHSYDDYVDLIKGNIKWAKAHKVDYAPLCFPGFSWRNMPNNARSAQIARNGGKFFWRQLSNAIKIGAEMLYIAMFDEIDEGTAIFKCAHEVPVAAPGSTFVPVDPEIKSDHYLWLSGMAGKMLRGELPLSENMPRRDDNVAEK